MPSKARQALTDSAADIDRLHEIHVKESGAGPGRKYHVEVLNKAAVVFVCAAWEAYCEDVVSEAIRHLTADCADPAALPEILKKAVADRVKKDPHEHAPWQLAGDGWRSLIHDNAAAVIQQLTGTWNTPKAGPIRDLFKRALGIVDITAGWHWAKNPQARTTETLDWFVARRGEIAHRLVTTTAVGKWEGQDFLNHVCRLADKIDAQVAETLKKATGNTYW